MRGRLYAVVIDKTRLAGRFLFDPNPYHVSLSLLLSLVCGPPGTPTPWRPNVVRIVVEKRGKVEDRQLLREYRSLHRGGLSSYGAADIQWRLAGTVARVFPERIDLAPKSRAIAGLELADLAAYPIGRAVVNDRWDNPAYLALASKVRALVTFP